MSLILRLRKVKIRRYTWLVHDGTVKGALVLTSKVVSLNTLSYGSMKKLITDVGDTDGPVLDLEVLLKFLEELDEGNHSQNDALKYLFTHVVDKI